MCERGRARCPQSERGGEDVLSWDGDLVTCLSLHVFPCLQPEELARSLSEARGKGITVRGIVVINPGNPTGQVLSRDNMESIIKVRSDPGLGLGRQCQSVSCPVTQTRWTTTYAHSLTGRTRRHVRR